MIYINHSFLPSLFLTEVQHYACALNGIPGRPTWDTTLFSAVARDTQGSRRKRPTLGSQHVSYRTAICWGTDLSAPQRQFAGEPTGLLPTPDSRPVGSPTAICRGADRSPPQCQISDLSVPQHRYAGEPTCLGYNADVRLVVADLDIAIKTS